MNALSKDRPRQWDYNSAPKSSVETTMALWTKHFTMIETRYISSINAACAADQKLTMSCNSNIPDYRAFVVSTSILGYDIFAAMPTVIVFPRPMSVISMSFQYNDRSPFLNSVINCVGILSDACDILVLQYHVVL